ncbi:MAG: hypothetical protein WC201_05145 [Bacilli bacterium]
MDIQNADFVMFAVFLVTSAVLALIGTQFLKGKWLEYITLIDAKKYDRESLSGISAAMMFACALAFSLCAVGFFFNLAGIFIVLCITVCIVTMIAGYYRIFNLKKI